MSADLARVTSRSRLRDDRPQPPPPPRREKGIAMRALEDQAPPDPVASQDAAQAGVKQVEAIAQTWDKASLALAYVGIALIAWATSLETLTTSNLTVYATSAFNSHSLVSTVLVIQGVVLSVVKPPMSKIADVFGRFEAFCLAVLLYTIGYIQQAFSNSVETYAAAQLFYSAGGTGLQILIQIFVADTSDLVNRALCATLPDIPFMVNVWIGPPLAEAILDNLSWRWGYGVWAIVLPVCFMPLAISLMVNKRKAERRGLLPASTFESVSFWGFLKRLWFELDAFGLLLICASFSLILIPLTLGSRMGWFNPHIIAMFAIGVACLIAFPLWEGSPRLAPHAFFPRNLLGNRTILAAFGVAFFYFMAFYLSVYPYFQSYLLVVMNEPLASAGRILQTFTFASTVTSIIVSFLIKRIRRYKVFVVLGTVVYTAGLILMFLYRKEGVSTITLVLTQAVVGIGGSLVHLPAQIGVQATGSHQEVAAATALFLTVLEIGGAVGSAISGAIWTSNVPRKLHAYLPPETRGQASAIYGNITLASTGWPPGDPTRVAINRAYQETMTHILGVAVCVSLPCIFLSLFMRDYQLDKMEQHVIGVVIGGHGDAMPDRDCGAPRSSSAGPAGASLRRPSSTSGTVRRTRHDDEEDEIWDDLQDEELADEQRPLFGSRSRSRGRRRASHGTMLSQKLSQKLSQTFFKNA